MKLTGESRSTRGKICQQSTTNPTWTGPGWTRASLVGSRRLTAWAMARIPHRLTRDRTRSSAVRDRRLTAWAMARPFQNHVTYRSQLSRCSLHSHTPTMQQTTPRTVTTVNIDSMLQHTSWLKHCNGLGRSLNVIPAALREVFRRVPRSCTSVPVYYRQTGDACSLNDHWTFIRH